jgi:cyclic beta-1,2-glucan synthetase
MTTELSPAVLAASQSEVFVDPFHPDPIRAEIYGQERLEAHARDLAAASVVTSTGPSLPLLRRLRDNGRALRDAYHLVAEAARRKEPLTADAEWLLDNFYIIEDVLRNARLDLPSGYYAELPRLISGPLAGLPRVYALALALVAHTDSSLSEGPVLQYVRAYQSVAPLTIGELWAVPTMLRLALLENLRRLARQLLQTRAAQAAATEWVNRSPHSAAPPVAEEAPDPFLIRLVQELRDHSTGPSPQNDWLEGWLARHNLTVADVLRREHQRQAANQVSIGNAVTSLRVLSALDWFVFFEQASVTEALLREDPAGVYPRQDFQTRDCCRRAVEQLARGSRLAEEEVARRALHRPGGAEAQGGRHFTYYLIGDGRPQFEAELRYRPKPADRFHALLTRHPNAIYFGGLAVLCAGLVAAFVAAGGWSWLSLLVFAAVLLPASGLGVGLLHFALSHLLPPRILPKLDFKDGIPPDCATFVVMPTLLLRPESAGQLLERLELHYLANPDPRLYFALLTDFADAAEENRPEDDSCVQTVLQGVRALNAKYAAGKSDRFFLFHRKRLWNPSEGCWMGWERKRGKLHEFNRLARGDRSTSYTVTSVPADQLPWVRYVITLDADTVLPRETARRLIATLAHPLNQAHFDAQQRRVVSGYGVLQPRVNFLFRTGTRSMFARLFAHSAGVDPYSAAVSDVYQDLFGSGSFTGKGIYDLDAFDAATGRAFPDNHILSHDLIEGNFARCGLVSDVELYDDFPAKYHAYARREHRWIRGDWQLLPWLGPRVPANDSAGKVPNPLPLLERWKVFDNLRRSLVPPSLIVLFVLGWTVLPGPPWLWTSLGVAVVALPLLLQLAAALLDVLRGGHVRAVARGLEANAPTTAGQVFLSAAFLANQARLSLDAIGVTLYRLWVSRRRLLEWETAAAAEQRLGRQFAQFMTGMWPSSALAVLLGGLLAVLFPGALLAASPLLALWFFAPLIAYWVSRPRGPAVPPLSADEARALRRVARKTWSFFEAFAGGGDNWLPPDNYQEVPKGLIAHRTSPTNIGLLLLSTLAAHDFGYLSLKILARRLAATFATLARLERHRGHFLNWYDTVSLRPLQPSYVSTVDSGNLLGCLIVLKNGLQEKLTNDWPAPAVVEGLADTLALMEGEFGRTGQRGSGDDSAWRAVAAAIQGLRRILNDLNLSDLLAYDKGLTELEQQAAALATNLHLLTDKHAEPPTELGRWLTAFAAEVKERREEVTDLAPWVGVVESALAGKWEELARPLTQPFRPGDWSKLHETYRAAVAEWRQPQKNGDAALADKLTAAVDASGAARLAGQLNDLAARAQALSSAMDFRFLFNTQRDLFSIGFNLSANRLDNSHYDLLASEACLASFLAVARGEVPKKHWFQLERPAVMIAGYQGLLSWGGTMFEYLMPRLLLPSDDGTLLDSARHAAVARQIEYARQHRVPWGMSESAFYLLDAAQDYQYQSFGVPGLGIKRGLALDLVVAPYATLLATMLCPHAVVKNLRALQALGAEGSYGFFEAVDFTASRLDKGERYQVVRSYMAHHQGMGFVALANRLLGDPMPRRFRAEPRIRAAELLLQERIPLDAPILGAAEDKEVVPQIVTGPAYPVSRRINTPHTPGPRTHLLSNGRYSVMLTNSGAGYSACSGQAVTRWRGDRTSDATGQFCYVRDLETYHVWSAGHQPVCRAAESYQVVFSIDKAEIRRTDHKIETVLEVVVSPEKNVEVRRVTLTNHSRGARKLELTSYAEVVLGTQAADLAHPAFHKLFLETEWVEGHSALLCRRRPRAADQKPLWAVHVLASEGGRQGPVQYETDRARFLGRRRMPCHPAACDRDAGRLSGTVGPVLDPIFSLRQTVMLRPGESYTAAFSTAVAESRDEALALTDEFRIMSAVTRAFDLAWAHSRVELRHMGISVEDAQLFQRLAGYVLFPTPGLRADPNIIAANSLGQPALWRHAISGDNPIVLVRLDDIRQLPLARQAMLAHSYWRAKGLTADLVFLNEAASVYRDDLHDQLVAAHTADPQATPEKPGGIFIRKATHLAEPDRNLLLAVAHVILSGDKGPLANQMDILERRASLPHRLHAGGLTEGKPTSPEPGPPAPKDLSFGNGTGGFTPDGREYVIAQTRVGNAPPAPWTNVIANANFGFLVTDGGGGYTWAGNSQMNRLTPWANDPVSDPPGEAIYLRDEATGEVWSPTPLPAGGLTAVTVRHGQGYTVFEQRHNDLDVTLRVSAAADDPVKFLRLTVRNRGPAPRQLSATFFAEWVLGVVREQTALHVVTEVDPNTGALFARNAYHTDFGGEIAFAHINTQPRTLTGDRGEFLGRSGSHALPAALKRVELSGRVGAALDPGAALQTKFELAAGEEKVVLFLLGQAGDRVTASRLVQRYQDLAAADAAHAAACRRWDDFLTTVQVRTPSPALDLLMNRWLLAQVLACRFWGRSAFYQSGGAFGFRDQLQDSMALVYAMPGEARAHLLRAASRQFEEGDVQHWWHPPAGRGVRTRFSDDFLWLPFAAAHYVAVTGDDAVLNETTSFLHAPPLAEGQDESYGLPGAGGNVASLYEHCVRALEHGWKLGAHGLPLMGTGDWNDGMNRVGAGGRGESVWLAWFQFDCLRRFAKLAEKRGDAERAATWRDRAEQLRKAAEEHAWDGGWYRRAYFDDGTPLGSASNDECRIDSLTQSWAVISGAADPDRARKGMAAVMEKLVRRPDRLILLLDPPFDKGKLDPGYIKGYLPGVRENGGQYTHAAVWVVQAAALLGRGTEAFELFDLLNPIRHTEDSKRAALYRVEPYVIAADVYGVPPHTGRGGWTWYTGSAAWYYRVALETILGFQKEGPRLSMAPCIPAAWKKFEIDYRHGKTVYQITVENPRGVERGVKGVWLDGRAQSDGVIELIDDGGNHQVRVEMGPP